MKLAAFFLTCLLALSCVSHERCGPTNCSGCCNPNDLCVENDPHVCSPAGAACAECDQFSICVSGGCVRPPFFMGPATVDFGQVALGTTGSAMLTFTNGGDQALVIRDAGVEPPTEFSGFGVSADAIRTVAPKDTATIVLTFSPPSIGGFGGTLIFDSNAGEPLYQPQVLGTGM